MVLVRGILVITFLSLGVAGKVVVVVGPIGSVGAVAFGKKNVGRRSRKRADARRGLVIDKIN